MVTVFVLLLISVTCAAAGPVLQSRGMVALGTHDDWFSFETFRYFWKALTTPSVILGTVLMAIAFFLNLALLARAPVSFIVPVTAMEYIVAVIMARVFLDETVPLLRWGGVGLIGAGIILLTISWKPDQIGN